MAEPQKRVQATYANLTAGDPAPWIVSQGIGKPQLHLSYHGGRYLVLGFLGDAADQWGKAALATVRKMRNVLNDRTVSFFGVTWTPQNQEQGLIKDEIPGIRFLLDYDGAASRAFGVLPLDIEGADAFKFPRRRWFVLDPQLRVLAVFPFKADGSDGNELLDFVSRLLPLDRFAGFEMPVPVMAVPFVFEPQLCRQLIEYYEARGGQKTGVLRQIGGKSFRITDETIKRRSDVNIEDPTLRQAIQDRLVRRVVPEIEKLHFMKCNRTERYIVGCYDAADHGFFRPHRDNTSQGSAHRRFAASINLNDDFEGGELNFPEYGSKWFKMPPGTAVVFSTPLLHQVSPVTRGRRYAFLPFLYDDEGAKIRERNIKFIEDGSWEYHAFPKTQ